MAGKAKFRVQQVVGPKSWGKSTWHVWMVQKNEHTGDYWYALENVPGRWFMEQELRPLSRRERGGAR